jgi:hypothetical protein
MLDVENTLTSDTVSDVIGAAQEPIDNVIDTVGKLSLAASKMPYYKFNNMWSRQMQGAVRLTSTHQAEQRLIHYRSKVCCSGAGLEATSTRVVRSNAASCSPLKT